MSALIRSFRQRSAVLTRAEETASSINTNTPFSTERNPAELQTAWNNLLSNLEHIDELSTTEKLRQFLLLYFPNYDSWTAVDQFYDFDEAKAAALPKINRKHLECLMRRITRSKVFELSELSEDFVRKVGLLEDLVLSFILSSAKHNLQEFLSINAHSAMISFLSQALARSEMWINQKNDSLRNLILLCLGYTYSCIRNLLPHAAKSLAEMEQFDASPEYSGLRRRELLSFSAELIKLLRIRGISIEAEKTATAMFSCCEKLLAVSKLAQEYVVESRLLNELVNVFGWPEQIGFIADDRSAFLLQFGALKLLAEAFGSQQNVLRWSALGGFLKLIDFVLWVAITFNNIDVSNVLLAKPGFAGQPLPPAHSTTSLSYIPTIAIPQQWLVMNGLLQACFNCFMRMALTPGAFEAPEQTPSSSSPSTPGAKRKSVHKAILCLFTDIFNLDIRQTKFNVTARNKLLNLPELQLFICRFIVQLTLNNNKLIPLLEECGTYDLLLGPFFLGLLRMRHATMLDASQVQKSPEDEESAALYHMELERYLFETISFVGAVNPSSNVVQCRLLLSLVDEFYEAKLFALCHRAATAILRMLEAKSILTSQSLVQLTAMPRFAKFIDHFRTKLVEEQNEQVKAEMIRVRSVLMRCLVRTLVSILQLPFNQSGKLDIQDAMLSTKALLKAATGDLTTIDSLFNMLMDPDTRTFAMSHIVHIMKADGMEIRNNFDQFYKLYERYLDTLLRVPSEGATNFELELLLLRGITSVLELKDCKEQQNLFREAEAFIKLTSLINIIEKACMLNAKPLDEICLAVLTALTSLMANNDENKEHFKNHIGYDQLKELILHAFNKQLPVSVLNALFDLLLDGKYTQTRQLDDPSSETELVGSSAQGIVHTVTETSKFADSRNLAVRNPHITLLMLKLFPYFQLSEQISLFDTLILLVKSSSINRSKFCNERVLFQLLKMVKKIHSIPNLATKLYTLIELLGEHSITVRELTKMIRLLRPLPGDLRPPWMPNILSIMEKMVDSKKSTFPVYFDFDGNKSALVLPSLPRWPLGRAGHFTFAAWICIESFEDPCGAPNYQPRLFSFLDENGYGMEAFFKNRQLHFQTIVQGRNGERKAFSAFTFEERTWYFVAITYSVTRILGRVADVKLYVDCQLKGKETVRPVTFQNLVHCRIGSNADVLGKDASEPIMRENSFHGQMGEITILDNELDVNQLDELKRGARPTSPDVLSQRGEWGNVFDGPTGMQARVIMCYNPRATTVLNATSSAAVAQKIGPYGSITMCFDTSPYARDATLVNGLTVVHRHHIKDVIGCVSGGIKALFPLYVLLDKPEVPYDTKSSESSSTDQAQSNSPGPSQKHRHPFDRTYSVPSLIQHSGVQPSADLPLDDDEADDVNLQKEPPDEEQYPFIVGSPEMTEQITRLFFKILSSSRELQNELRACGGFATISYILLKVSPHNLSEQLLHSLGELLSHQSLPHDLEDDLIMNLLLDFHLWIYTRFSVQKCLLRYILPRALASRKHLRTAYGSLVVRLLESMRTFYWYLPSQDVMAIDPIVHTPTKKIIASRPSPTHVRYLRQCIISLIDSVIHPEISFDELRDIVLFLLDCTDPEITVDSLQLLHRLIYSDSACINHIKNLGKELFLICLDSKSCRVRTAAIAILNAIVMVTGIAMEWPDPLLVSMHHSLQKFPLDPRTYNALFAFTVGNMKSANRMFSKLDVDDTTKITRAPVLPILMRLACSTSPEFTQQLLQDVALLVSCREDNRDTILSGFAWPLWLFEALHIGDDEETRRVLFDMTMNVFRALVLHRLQQKSGWQIMYEIDMFVKLSTENGDPFAAPFLRSLLRSIIATLKRDLLQLKQRTEFERLLMLKDMNKNPHVLVNVVHFVFFITEYLYSMDVADPIIRELRRDPTFAPAAVCDDLIASDLVEVVFLMEQLELGKDLTVIATSTANSFKKGIFRTSGGIALILKLAATLLYTVRDEGNIKDCLSVCKLRLSRLKSSKLEEVHYFFFHVLQALSRIKDTAPAWCTRLQQCVFPVLHEQFKNYKPQFSILKKLNYTHLEYLDTIRDGAMVDLSAPILAEILAILRQKLSGVELDDISAQESVSKQQNKSLKSIQLKYRKMKDSEIEVLRKALDQLSALKHQHLSKPYKRIISNSILTEAYAKTSRRWRNILRSLKNERGPWGARESKIHWKLSPCENSLRMRLKMKRNYAFNDHRDAVRTSKSQSAQQPQQLAVPSDLSVNKDFLLESMGNETESARPDLSKVEEDDSTIQSSTTTETVAEKPVYTVYCELIRPMKVIKGTLEITWNALHFKETVTEASADHVPKEKIWPIDQIREVHLRRYLLVQSALEIFLTDKRNYFLNFNKRDRNKVFSKILRLNPPRLIYSESRSPEEIFRNSGLTKKWQTRQISNFEYLMHLNTIAGRTYNDLCQYPVFPWVLSDYTSEKIDLSDERVYRDLSKPIGALNEERLKYFQERYESWSDGLHEGPPFLYGSHYSSAATVLFYLIRMEPFTTMAIQLQGGKFDISDRLFWSIPQCWSNCLTSTSDVKELIPEFFYLPDFLENKNNFNFGKRYNGEEINDVKLPPWASTPEEFIRINRLALESEYVSAHLHEWIDLIFGYKQRGPEAKKANNVFHYLTYEGAVDIESITDPHKRLATELTIAEFGQTPAQLLRRPHPPRNAYIELTKELSLPPAYRNSLVLECSIGDDRIVWLACRRSDIVCLEQSGHVKFLQIPFVFNPSPTQSIFNSPSPTRERIPSVGSHTISGAGFSVMSPIADDMSARLMLPHLSGHQTFAISSDGTLLFSSNREDNSLKSTVLESFKPIQSLQGHHDSITCLAITEDGRTLVTASKDTTLLVWNISLRNGMYYIDESPKFTLNGHNDEVVCIAVSADLDMCVSGSKDSTVLIHELVNGAYVRCIQSPANRTIDNLAISSLGYILVHSRSDLSIQLYSVNGKWIRSADAHEHVTQMIVSKDGEYVITAGKKGWVFIRTTFELKVVHKYQLGGTVWSLALSPDEQFIIVGLEDGRVCVLHWDHNAMPKVGYYGSASRQKQSTVQ